MPTDPVKPTSHAAIDRLTLGVDFARTTEPCGNLTTTCSLYLCFEAEASAAAGVCGRCFCFESD